MDNAHDAGVRFDKSPSDPDWIRCSSIVGPMDPTKQYPPFDSALAREPSISSSLDAASAIEEPGYSPSENGSSVPPSGPSTLRPSVSPSIGIQNRSKAGTMFFSERRTSSTPQSLDPMRQSTTQSNRSSLSKDPLAYISAARNTNSLPRPRDHLHACRF